MSKQYFYNDKSGKTLRHLFCVRGCQEPYKKEDLDSKIIKISDHAHMCMKCAVELGLKAYKKENFIEHPVPQQDIPEENLEIPEDILKEIQQETSPVKTEKKSDSFYAYVIKCADGTYFSGVTLNLETCVINHNRNKSSRYTRPAERRPVIMVKSQEASSLQDAKKTKLEFEKEFSSPSNSIAVPKSTPVIEAVPSHVPAQDPMEESGNFYAYVIKCNDGTFYAGITSNIDNCVHAHNTNKGSKFTRPAEKKPVVLVTSREAKTMDEAKKLKIELEKENFPAI